MSFHPWPLVQDGVAPFNGGLFGTVIAMLYPAFVREDAQTEMWAVIVIGAFFR